MTITSIDDGTRGLRNQPSCNCNWFDDSKHIQSKKFTFISLEMVEKEE